VISALFLCLSAAGTQAGEVSGLPAHLPPTLSPDYSFFLGNDFAAVGTSDDYRTEQMIVSARLRESWIAVLDHSIMTREDLAVGERGRWLAPRAIAGAGGAARRRIGFD